MKGNEFLESFSFQECVDWNPKSNSNAAQFEVENQNYHASNNSEKSHKRPSHKNKYLNKIKENKPEQTSNTKKRRGGESDLSIPFDELKKLKNRSAAKESRERKKIYINLIEQQTKKLEEELSTTNKQIQKCKIEIQKSTFNNNQSIGAFDNKLIHVQRKLEKLINSDEGEERSNQMNLALDSIIYRFGAAGKERLANVEERYQQIISIAPPIIHRYLLWSAKERAHMFCTKDSYKEQNQKWFSQLSAIIKESVENNSSRLAKTRNQLTRNLEQILLLTGKLSRSMNQLANLCTLIDNLFLEVREVLTPLQSAKFILFIEKYRYRQELRYHERVESEQIEVLSLPKKHIKQQLSE